METPNTRSRRKREADSSSQEERGVIWVHDQSLRRAVLDATSDDPIALPAPTQKPRPISSNMSPSAFLSGESSSRPRKRPCRKQQSLPVASRQSISHTPLASRTLNGSSSAPNFGSEGESSRRMDQLLLEAVEKFGLGSSSHLSAIGIPEPSRTVGKFPPSCSSSTRPKSESISTTTTESLSSRSEPNKPTISRPLRMLSSDTRLRVKSSESSEVRVCLKSPPIEPRSPLSPLKGGIAPRLGWRAGRPPQATPNARPLITNQRAFKPPLIAQQPTRSSPRRAIPVAHDAKPPLRGLPNATTPSLNKIVDNPAPARRIEGLSNHPSSDGPDGNESFDSFDGIFAEGGEETEQFLAIVDGLSGKERAKGRV